MKSAFIPILLLLGVLCTPIARAEDTSGNTRCEQSFEKNQSVNEMIDLCRQELTGPVSDPDRINILQTLGQIYLSQGETDLAISTWYEASQYTPPKRNKPEQVDRWTQLQVLIGQTHSQLGDNQKAETQFLNTLDAVNNLLGPYSLPVGVVRDSLGTLYALQGDKDKALFNFKRSRIIHEVRLGKLHPRTIETRLNQAVGLLDLKLEDDARNSFDVLAQVINDVPAYRNAPIRAEVLTFLGTLQMRADLVDEASKNYETAYQVRSTYYGSGDLRTSQSLNNLGVVLYRAGDLKGAEKALSQAYVIRREKLGIDDPLTTSTQKNLQAVLQAQRDAQK